LPSSPPSASAAPDGGLAAWLVIAGAFSVNVCTLGYLNTFGIYEAYYAATFLSHKTPSQIAWIGSLQLFFLFFAGVVAGPLFDLYGARRVLIPTVVLYVFSVMMTSLCKEYYQFILAQGILGGFTSGLVLTPALSIPGQYFSSKRATAMGISVSGSSVGGVIFPEILERLLNHSSLGFGWTVRIIGFIILALLTIACVTMVERLPSRKGKLILPAAFKSLPYNLTVLGVFCTLWGLYTPLFYISTYSLAHGMSEGLAFDMVAVSNAASFFGRVIPGILADVFGRFQVMIFMSAITGILIFCWIKATTNAGIIVFISFYGFASGAVISLFSACLIEVTPNPGVIGTYIGMAMGISSFAGLTGTPITGALLKNSSSYTDPAIFSGVVVMAGAVSLLCAKLLLMRTQRYAQ